MSSNTGVSILLDLVIIYHIHFMKININDIGVTEAAKLMTDGELTGIILGVVLGLVAVVTTGALLVLWFVDVLPQ